MIMKIAIVHYDISMQTGAQRLVLGMGNSLKKLGHEVAYFTAIYDQEKAFEEFRNENVIVSNGKLDYFGRFRAITAYRESKEMMKTGINKFKPDLYVFSSNYYLADNYKPSMIYCHHPEQLLIRKGDFIRKLLHFPIDRAENKGFKETDIILCNSDFTKSAINEKFNRNSTIIFPGVDVDKFTRNEVDEEYILTVNRIVPNKNLIFAIELIDKMKKRDNKIKLIIIGVKQVGFEWHLDELNNKIKELDLSDNIEIHTNVTDSELVNSYKNCSVFLYTPKEEHFGIAPIEAMACGKPVIAFNTGGPKETIINDITGYLLEEDLDQWENKIFDLLKNNQKRMNMSIAARNRIVDEFSWDAFMRKIKDSLDKIKVN
ncbi:MAG: hypothetical protein CMO19_02525 [Thaumarchaeota archaeon]|nr:hypothetical protein [Nitrososphaerota archaeon]|tara:strand:+ start:1879 stop:2997 length:1119 start_codon:yes stop_codon:yes gene_type:complete